MAQSVAALMDDGSELTRQAWRLLEAEAKDLGLESLRIQPISEFLEAAEQHSTSVADRRTILDQAVLIFDHLYPHRTFKQSIYKLEHPSDYIQREILPHIEEIGELDFHTRVIAAFALVRDAHTLYGLPSPYRGAVAFLPFQMRPYLDQKSGWRMVVTSVMNSQPDAGFGHPYFGPGAEILSWGNLDVLAHVERTETHLPGGNYFASFMRGAIHSTLRPLTYVQIPFPDELPSAVIRYRPLGDAETHFIRIPWAVGTGFGASAGFPSSVYSVSPATAIARHYSKLIHQRSTANHSGISTIPQMFEFRYTGDGNENPDPSDEQRPEARFGYIHIKAFTDGSSAPGSTERIVAEFQRIVTIMDRVAPDGLIIDVQGNPGGNVEAAECMLQMLTAQPIEPARFHLANTESVLDILKGLKTAGPETRAELSAWADDAALEPHPHGPALTSGQPLTDPEDANEIGQIYHGRGVALLIDSLTYSAADIFAAGFQDHEIGIVLGTSLVTGGGGANVWTHQDVLDKIGPRPGMPLAPLPGDAAMTVAIRRSSRVRRFEGEPVEDQGVAADIYYVPESVEDLMSGNSGLLQRACWEFRDLKAFRIDVVSVTSGAVTLKTVNVDSLKFFMNGQPILTVEPIEDGQRTVSLPASGSLLRIEGYSGGQLVRARTIRIETPALDTFDPATQSITGTEV